ncbi:Uncharacterised protein [Mycobacterium tuberculosis]|nr:Uncharacterised protein [Mycobacterium tuberculosis]
MQSPHRQSKEFALLFAPGALRAQLEQRNTGGQERWSIAPIGPVYERLIG